MFCCVLFGYVFQGCVVLLCVRACMFLCLVCACVFVRLFVSCSVPCHVVCVRCVGRPGCVSVCFALEDADLKTMKRLGCHTLAQWDTGPEYRYPAHCQKCWIRVWLYLPSPNSVHELVWYDPQEAFHAPATALHEALRPDVEVN